LIGVCSVVVGLFSAFYFDTPVGPSIVVVATIFFVTMHYFPATEKQ